MTPNCVSGQAKPSEVSVKGGNAISPAALRCAGVATSWVAVIFGSQIAVTFWAAAAALTAAMMPGTRKTVEETKLRTMRMGFLGREGMEKAGRQIRTQVLTGSCRTDAGFAGFCRAG